MHIKASIPNHDNSSWYELMAHKAEVWNTLGEELEIEFQGGYDHYQCEFASETRLDHGLLKIFGKREYVNGPNPVDKNRFSEVLKIEFSFFQEGNQSAKTMRNNWFTKISSKKSNGALQLKARGRLITFSSSDLRLQLEKTGMFKLPHFYDFQLSKKAFVVTYHQLFEIPKELEIVRSLISFLKNE